MSTRFLEGKINTEEKKVAQSFASEMSVKGFNLDFTYHSLEHEIDNILTSKLINIGEAKKADWRMEAGLEAYVGETLALLFNGAWKGSFDSDNPAGNFYLSYVEFGEYQFYPSHFLCYRISNGPKEGTFCQYLEKVIPKIKERKSVS